MNKRQIKKQMSEFEKALYDRIDTPMLVVGPLTTENVKVGAMSIANINNPSWGTFGVKEVQTRDGEISSLVIDQRMLDVAEFCEWVVVKSYWS